MSRIYFTELLDISHQTVKRFLQLQKSNWNHKWRISTTEKWTAKEKNFHDGKTFCHPTFFIFNFSPSMEKGKMNFHVLSLPRLVIYWKLFSKHIFVLCSLCSIHSRRMRAKREYEIVRALKLFFLWFNRQNHHSTQKFIRFSGAILGEMHLIACLHFPWKLLWTFSMIFFYLWKLSLQFSPFNFFSLFHRS